ncbi:MAG TPA: heavy metal translocating P-type ATPase [Devosiaceae bacterium]
MSCCAPGAEAAAELAATPSPETDDETLLASSRALEDGLLQLELAVPDVHCAACMSTLESALGRLDMVDTARVNLSTKRVRIAYRPGSGRPSDLTRAITGTGYRTFLLDPEAEAATDRSFSELLRALAVSGFAAANIMLFSVSIWSGADPVTRDLFHWISALIALPAIGYAGRPFFRSAFRALRHGVLNMDVPISLGVLLAAGLSLYETLVHGENAYFDASVSLLFFLLIGRTLDHMMREKARSAVRNLARLAPGSAIVVHEDGHREHVPIREIAPGMIIELPAGERVPVDATVIGGQSEVDLSLVTGESVPEPVAPGSALLSGAINISGVLTLRATRPAADSFLARMISLMEAAEGSRAGYKRLADRAAAIYAPAVHILALATFAGWLIVTGGWHDAIVNAVAVLIITCPCALALAVPIVHVVAAGRLFERGVMMRDGAALERLADVDRVVFDKTGTLTEGRPVFSGQMFGDPAMRERAAILAAVSRHPFSRALVAASGPVPQVPGEFREEPGHGIEARLGDGVWRLGRAEWCGAVDTQGSASAVWLSRDGVPVAAFGFDDAPRPDAAAAIAELARMGKPVTLLSGDRPAPVADLARRLGIADFAAGLTPAGKLERLQDYAARGERVLMVGDGINDAPALRAAHVSMAPSTAADVGRNAADFIFTRDSLLTVVEAMRLARRAASAVRENFALALIYNVIAVPLAVTGHVTPLIAALAMSSSSILVTLNALKLRLGDTLPASAGQKAGRAVQTMAAAE